MGKVTKEWEALGDYIFGEKKWGDDAMPIILLCVEDDDYGEIAAEVLEYIKSTPDITPDMASDKALELREKKYGKQKFVVVDDN